LSGGLFVILNPDIRSIWATYSAVLQQKNELSTGYPPFSGFVWFLSIYRLSCIKKMIEFTAN
jgi:hypothetical protein